MPGGFRRSCRHDPHLREHCHSCRHILRLREHCHSCRHIPRVRDYLWVAEDGMKMQGYNGSQLWDTAFTVQAYVATGLLSECSEALRHAHTYIQDAQVVAEAQEPLPRFYRHISKGAWPFSSRDHGWPISDCTSEVRPRCYFMPPRARAGGQTCRFQVHL